MLSDTLKKYVEDHKRHLCVSISRYLIKYISEGHRDPPEDFQTSMSLLHLSQPYPVREIPFQSMQYLNPVMVCYCLLHLGETERHYYEDILDMSEIIGQVMLMHFDTWLSDESLIRYSATA